MYYLRIDGVNYPVAPEKFKETMENKNSAVGLVTQDVINLIKKSGLSSFSITIRLPRDEYSWAYYEQSDSAAIGSGFHEPEVYVDLLRELKTDRKHFEVMLIKGEGTDVTSQTIDCTLEDCSFEESAEDGDDITATCTFKEYREYVTKIVNQKGSTTTTTTSKKTLVPKKKRYDVKKGDTLKRISKKIYGSQKYASKIYSWNKAIIEDYAKKNKRKSSNKGKYLYKGCRLVLKTIKLK